MKNSKRAFDIVIVGAGPSGIAAGSVAAELGKSVAVIDTNAWLGGQIWPGMDIKHKVRAAKLWIKRLEMSGAEMFLQTAVIDANVDKKTVLAETSDGTVEFTYGKLIVATGAREIFVPFPGWTLPNVYGAGGLQVLAKADYPVKGKRVVVAGTGPLLFAVASKLRMLGAKVLLLAEQAGWVDLIGFGMHLPFLAPSKIIQAVECQTKLLGVPYKPNCWPIKAEGDGKLESVTMRRGNKTWTIKCDYLAYAFGLAPNLELPELLGCNVKDGFVVTDDFHLSSVDSVYCTGELTGVGGVDSALIEGQIAALAASSKESAAKQFFATRKRYQMFTDVLAEKFALRPELKTLYTPETIICRCEDVKAEDMADFDDWRSAKLQTRCGMGACQGRTCGCATNILFGWQNSSPRPPIYPAKLQSLE
jgi:NADPH-dependent 2,4-dienoyl-CoA reductase/sulfur reductase-like enzyme